MMLFLPTVLLKTLALTLLVAQCSAQAADKGSPSSSTSSRSSDGYAPKPSSVHQTASQKFGAGLGKAYNRVVDGTKATFVYAPVAAAQATKDTLTQGGSGIGTTVKGVARGFSTEAKKPGTWQTKHNERLQQRKDKKELERQLHGEPAKLSKGKKLFGGRGG